MARQVRRALPTHWVAANAAKARSDSLGLGGKTPALLLLQAEPTDFFSGPSTIIPFPLPQQNTRILTALHSKTLLSHSSLDETRSRQHFELQNLRISRHLTFTFLQQLHPCQYRISATATTSTPRIILQSSHDIIQAGSSSERLTPGRGRAGQNDGPGPDRHAAP